MARTVLLVLAMAALYIHSRCGARRPYSCSEHCLRLCVVYLNSVLLLCVCVLAVSRSTLVFVYLCCCCSAARNDFCCWAQKKRWKFPRKLIFSWIGWRHCFCLVENCFMRRRFAFQFRLNVAYNCYIGLAGTF